ncbi:oligosaccharide flippase family protein [Pontibacter sp. G13]|uniref:lipopolysaccharide biosynthesis protein n=1 Tax=Pontibacter sp. G13 TaxID=3074898 RepID=UPI00288937C7|nr:oligosaccharide flippase family protein [Pontibacter sp. G13]WNJ17976.1 oligosaccharide flippase family protein [Pontibacter sp. G13]
MSVLKKLAGQTLIYGASNILARLLNILLTPIYTNQTDIIPTDDYGIFSSLYAYVAFANVILTFGMETTFFRFVQQRPEKHIYNQAFLWVMTIATAVLGMLAVFHPYVANWLEVGDRPILVLMLLGIIFLDVVAALPLAKLRHEDRIMRFSSIILTNVVVTLAANVIFVIWLRKGIEYVFLSNLIASAVRLSMALFQNAPSSLKPDRPVLRQMIDYGFFIMLGGVGYIINETLDRIMIPKMWEDGQVFQGIAMTGETMTGIYSANYKVAILIGLATQAFRYAVEPFFFKEAKKDKSPENFAKIFHYFTLAALTGFLVLSSFAHEVVSFNFFGIFGEGKTFVGEEYWIGLPVVPILLGAYIFQGAYINISIWYKLTDQTRFALLFTFSGALVTILINYFGIPIYGYMACAWATLISYGLMATMVYLFGQRYYPVPYRVSRLMLYGALCVGAFFLNSQIGPAGAHVLSWIFKIGICLGVVGIVGVLEKWKPLFR